jgi:hypothetical protein
MPCPGFGFGVSPRELGFGGSVKKNTFRHDAYAYAPIDVKMQPVPFPSVLKMVFVCVCGGRVT